MTDFAALHQQGTFVMPNPRDPGEAKLFEAMGFAAVATTSAGFAATLGRMDQSIDLATLARHVESLTAAVTIPVSVDAENGFADDPESVAATVEALAEVGAGGVSIEDYDPASGALYEASLALERVQAAAEAAVRRGLVLTARCEALLYGLDGLDATLERLSAYRDAGAHCLYAPGPKDLETIERIVAEIAAPVNVLALPGGATVDELRSAGVRRVSVGSTLSNAATAIVAQLAHGLSEGGGLPADVPTPPSELIHRAWRAH